MKIWKRNAVVMTVILFVCVALYLSWSYNRPGEEPIGIDSFVSGADGELQVSDVVPNEADLLEGAEIGVIDPDSNTIVQAPAQDENQNDYFANARLSRQRARDSALALLSQVANGEDNEQAIKSNAAAEIETLAKETIAEAKIEQLVIAKGFSDCMAFMSNGGIKIVVAPPSGGLLASDVAKIQEIVADETALTANDIKISEAKV
jgi:stage III sporulation protein AH